MFSKVIVLVTSLVVISTAIYFLISNINQKSGQEHCKNTAAKDTVDSYNDSLKSDYQSYVAYNNSATSTKRPILVGTIDTIPIKAWEAVWNDDYSSSRYEPMKSSYDAALSKCLAGNND